jgi:hypothetical protein
MTKTQTGEFYHGMYGYPVDVTLAPAAEGEEQLVLTGATAITLNLNSSKAATVAARPLVLPDAIINPGSVGIPAVIRWVVAIGDIPDGGSYRMTLTIDLPGPKRAIVEGLFLVE